ncbi:erythroid differentiation-related factor 1-like [Mizuhopecten yessoensis]|uniref:Erythroid differentiation-related factor 1 n=1 Tax=Mizuhopecten yessoensis TaxID=6573 RepID=A0A210PPA4_MIZYE|nr:erythroid differentiation-related factor 1-like [Mizuhopecten yessoensis]OWF38276.1 Erythroid differentiation-related factor 1 [Mizuhopecten yessoensis]
MSGEDIETNRLKNMAQPTSHHVVQKEKDSNKEVKSMAILKNATVHFSPNFSLLQRNTNLNVPPSNWLRQTSVVEQNIHDFTQHQNSKSYLSSIEMAGNSLDLTGDVDVITNAQNIKKLLKIPFSRSHISMMVHRIGKSLLLDEFDIHKHLLRQQQDDWKWLREFYYDCVARDMQMKCVPRKDKSRHKQQTRNMYSKFLYHSIADANPCENIEKEFPVTRVLEKMEEKELNLLHDNPSETPSGDFHKEILWMFEDIRMLIGTDLPIFCGNNYPCISLKLRDMRTPINVLTGLDYWLDNLMCNVPEVAMCFHLNGIVQRYELIKTEDIPNMEGSRFDPQEVTEIARNILSFLKANATKEGHTYWLYKGNDDDVVKLYDLTALCGDNMEGSNPFTIPLGMLLYRVARNLRQQHQRKKAPTVRTLLENCLLLLMDDQHSQVCTSAYYLLSDLYVPDSTMKDDEWENSDVGESDEEMYDNDSCQEEEDSRESTKSLDIKNLSDKKQESRDRDNPDITQVRPIVGGVMEKCAEALNNIHKGLQCLDRDFTEQIRKSKNRVEEQVWCDSNQAIPLHYVPLQKSAPPHNESEPPLHDLDHLQLAETGSSCSWHRLSKVLLLRKAAMAFYSLAKKSLTSHKAGCAMRYIKSALRCFAGVGVLLPQKFEENKELLMYMLGLVGDIVLMFIHDGQMYDDISVNLIDYTEEEIGILDSVERELDAFEYSWACDLRGEKEKLLQQCCACYQNALDLANSHMSPDCQAFVVTLCKRYGNVKNEMGVFFMGQAQVFLQRSDLTSLSPHMECLCERSQESLDGGISSFESVNDAANQALLHSNKGRLMRLRAQAHTQITLQGDNPEFSQQERTFYCKAIDCYRVALTLLKSHTRYPDIWESVCWELSTTYYNMAVLLQDCTPLSTEPRLKVEKEVTDLMTKSLKYCDMGNTSVRQPMYQYRAGSVNHRLASLYHKSILTEVSDQKRKYLRHLADTQYSKAAHFFSAVDCHVELLRTRLEHFALLEFILAGLNNMKLRLKTLTSGVALLIECESVLTAMLAAVQEGETDDKNRKESLSLLGILDTRLQFSLLQLVKCYTTLKRRKSDQEQLKSLYAKSLKKASSKGQESTGECNEMTAIGTHLVCLLTEFRKFYKDTLLHDPG